jgi:hypothetical protein
MQIAPLSQNVFGNFADVDAIQCSINFIEYKTNSKEAGL